MNAIPRFTTIETKKSSKLTRNIYKKIKQNKTQPIHEGQLIGTGQERKIFKSDEQKHALDHKIIK